MRHGIDGVWCEPDRRDRRKGDGIDVERFAQMGSVMRYSLLNLTTAEVISQFRFDVVLDYSLIQ
jgi:hypothetical protein